MSSAMLQSVNESPKPSRTLRKQTKLAHTADDSNDPSAEMDLSMDGERESGDEADDWLSSDDSSDSGFELEDDEADDEGMVCDSDLDETEENDIADDLLGEAVTDDGAETTDAANEDDVRVDHADPSVDSNIQRFRRRLRFVVDKMKACADEWDPSRGFAESAFAARWHRWWKQVGGDAAIATYLPAISSQVQQRLGKKVLTKKNLLQLPQCYDESRRMGVYIDVVEKTVLDTVGLYVGSGTSEKGMWGRVSSYFRLRRLGRSGLHGAQVGNAHCEAVVDPNNRINLRAIAKFAEKTPVAFVLSLETVMILFFDACKKGFTQGYRPEELLRLLKESRQDMLDPAESWESLNGTLPSKQRLQTWPRGPNGAKGAACDHCSRTAEDRKIREKKCGIRWFSADRESPGVMRLCEFCHRCLTTKGKLPSADMLTKYLAQPVWDFSKHVKKDAENPTCSVCLIEGTTKATRVRYNVKLDRLICKTCYKRIYRSGELPPPSYRSLQQLSTPMPCGNCGNFLATMRTWCCTMGEPSGLRCGRCWHYRKTTGTEWSLSAPRKGGPAGGPRKHPFLPQKMVSEKAAMGPVKWKQAMDNLTQLAIEAQARKDRSERVTGRLDGPSGDQKPVPANVPSSAARKSAKRTEVQDSEEDEADQLVSSPTDLRAASTFSVDPSEIRDAVPADDSSRLTRKGKKRVRTVIPDSEGEEEEEDSFSSSHPRAVPTSSVDPSERAGPQTADDYRRSSRKRKQPVRSGMVGWSDKDLE
ncbi:MAG: hypothetical protein Q9215_006283 [Flavoplaca cf. flavocitrina]